MSKNNIKKFIFYFLIILIVFVLDRVSKIYVINYFESIVIKNKGNKNLKIKE